MFQMYKQNELKILQKRNIDKKTPTTFIVGKRNYFFVDIIIRNENVKVNRN